MRSHHTWSSGYWGAFVCTLFGLSFLMHSAFAAGAVAMAGALVLLVWAVLLSHRKQ